MKPGTNIMQRTAKPCFSRGIVIKHDPYSDDALQRCAEQAPGMGPASTSNPPDGAPVCLPSQGGRTGSYALILTVKRGNVAAETGGCGRP